MIVKTMQEKQIEDIGHAFGYYDYGNEQGLVSVFSDRDGASVYIQGFVRGMLKGGFLHTTSERGEGYIAFQRPGERFGWKAGWPIVRGALQSMRGRQIRSFVRAMKRGGPGLRARLDKEKKPYLFVGLVCVREAYQHQGYMRRLLDIAFSEGNRLGVPVILETDAMSKCEKYMHLGMELAGTRTLGQYGKLYDLIKYPDARPVPQM